MRLNFPANEGSHSGYVEPMAGYIWRSKVRSSKQKWDALSSADVCNCDAVRVVHEIRGYEYRIEAFIQHSGEVINYDSLRSRKFGRPVGGILRPEFSH
jgi:hypothetical protein